MVFFKILVNTTNCLVDRYFSPTVRTGRAVNRHKTILICINGLMAGL
jgi:hypothetical protein